MKIPKPIVEVSESFERLPGIGPKSAQRLTFYLLHVPQGELDRFASALTNLKKKTTLCAICRNVSEGPNCLVCSDSTRNAAQIMVVEQPLDVIAFEKGGTYKGVYHVLHGVISPLENIGPDELYVADLLTRIKTDTYKDVEVILATNPTMEGEATALYLTKKIREVNSAAKISRLGMGIPTGANIEYADELTLGHALEGRIEMK